MSNDQAPNLDGRVLARTYRVEGLLAAGGMGWVYRARHLRTGGAVAIKLLNHAAQVHPDLLRRFQEEARITSALRHPNIIQVTDFDEDDDGTPFLVMELLEGEDLFQRLKRLGRLPLDSVLETAVQVGGALQAAHDSGVLHRDVKPQNIFFARHTVEGQIFEEAKILDFGLSKMQQAPSQKSVDHMAPGTPFYMAPEIILGKGSAVDGRADQYSLGVVLYRALSGRLPFEAEGDVRALVEKVLTQVPPPLLALVPGLPVGVSAAVMRALQKSPEGRFPSMNAFVRGLTGQSYTTGRRVVPPAPPPPREGVSLDSAPSLPHGTLPGATGQFVQVSRPRRPALRDRRVALGAVAGLLCAGLLVAVGYPPRAPAPAPAPAPAAPAPAAPLSPPKVELELAEPAAPEAQAPTPEEPAPPKKKRRHDRSQAPKQPRKKKLRKGAAKGKAPRGLKAPRGKHRGGGGA